MPPPACTTWIAGRTHHATQQRDAPVAVRKPPPQLSADAATGPWSREDGQYFVGERIAAEVRKAGEIEHVESLPWEEFAGILKLDAEQAAKARIIIDAAKQDFAEVYAKPAKDGPSPFLQLVEQLRNGASADVLLATLNRANTQLEAASGKNYMEVFAEKDTARRKELGALLRPEQIALYPNLPISSLSKVATGKSPFREALAVAAFGAGATADRVPDLAPVDLRRFENFRRALKLDDKQAEAIRGHINRLKDDVVQVLSTKPGPSEPSPLEVLEANRDKGNDIALKMMTEQAATAKDPATGKVLTEMLRDPEDPGAPGDCRPAEAQPVRSVRKTPWLLLQRYQYRGTTRRAPRSFSGHAASARRMRYATIRVEVPT